MMCHGIGLVKTARAKGSICLDSPPKLTKSRPLPDECMKLA